MIFLKKSFVIKIISILIGGVTVTGGEPLLQVKFLIELFKKLKEAKDQEEKYKIAIETGKLLTEELLNNTIDNTGLTKTC